MRQIRCICFVICLIYIFSSVSWCTAAALGDQGIAQSTTGPVQAPDNTVYNSCRGIDATVSMLSADPGIKNVTSAFLYEVKSDTLMYAINADEKMYPSSLVKIMTALIAAERGNPDDSVKVREDVLSTLPYDAVSVNLQPDEVISLGDLLYCMMVGSANDAAAVIADHICGSQEAFVQLMNEYAQDLGCTATNFTNVHGLHNDEQYTTARDLSRILSAAVKNDEFVSYFSAIRYTVPATNKTEARELSSNNSLMNSDDMQIYYDERVTGGRTGTTEDGKKNLAAAAQSNDMQLISIVLGSESVYDEDSNRVTVFGSFKETSALLDAGFNGFKIAQVLFPDQVIGQQAVLNGDSDVVLGVRSSAYAVLPENVSSKDLSYRYIDSKSLEAPINAGEALSQVQVWNGNMCVAQADLIAMNGVSVMNSQSMQHDKIDSDSNVKTVFIVVILIVLSAVVIVFAIRYVSVLRHKIRQKRYRKARRRSR